MGEKLKTWMWALRLQKSMAM